LDISAYTPVTHYASTFEQVLAFAVTAFILLTAGVSIVAYRRRTLNPGIPGSIILGPHIRGWYFENLQPFEEQCIRHSISPALLSCSQLIGSAMVGLCYATGLPFVAGWLLLLTGSLDIIDGRVARRTGAASARGAFLDSVIDRYAESFTYFGLAISFRSSPFLWAVLFALLGSMMVSYARARAEGLGAEARVGTFQRPERVVTLGFGTIFAVLVAHMMSWSPGSQTTLLGTVIIAIAVLANATAFKRIRYTLRELGAARATDAISGHPVGGDSAVRSPADPSAHTRIEGPPGKAKRVLGVFVLMIGVGAILDAAALWSGLLLLLIGGCILASGLLAFQARAPVVPQEDVQVSSPVGSSR
jgi:CDP-diacylglycerol--glycerol-3-phosphate 3-phosphatidyltransferase